MEFSLTLRGRWEREALLAELREALARRGLAATTLPDGRLDVRGGNVRAEIVVGDEEVVVGVRGIDAPPRQDAAGWIADAVVAPLLDALSSESVGDWITDRWARRPFGPTARAGYRDPTHHRPSFGAVLDALCLQPEDLLLEIGCGGGAFLQQALRTGCRAVGIDHSPDLVEVARDLNAEAIAAGRLEIVEGDALQLPFDDDTFTCAAMMQVLFFLDAPRVLAECRRVLRPPGRVAVFTVSEAARGTPAAPEPVASRSRFYADEQLVRLARDAGFRIASLAHPDLERHARAAGLPEDVVAMVRDPNASKVAQLLLARG